MSFWNGWKERFLLEGTMPERALLRLRRAGIALFNVKKIEKNRIVFSIKRKDGEKVFAIYSNMCYNESVYSAYTVKKIGVEGVGKYVETAKLRVGLLLGGLLCVTMVLCSQPLVFAVDFVGPNVYAREVYAALEEVGITPLAPYPEGKEDLVCAKLLALDGIEFCSVRKEGYRVIVEMRKSPFPSIKTDKNPMQAKHAGEIVAMTVLRGSPLKQIGEKVQVGEPLVDNVFFTEGGGQVRVEIIARVRIACVYEADVAAETAEEAFATAYLGLELSERDEVQTYSVKDCDGVYHVTIAYTAIEIMNF